MRRGHTGSCACTSHGHGAAPTCTWVSRTGRRSGSTLPVSTETTSTRDDTRAGRQRPSGGHHVAHHQIRDESRQTQINGGMHVCKPFNDARGCTADEKDFPLKARHVCVRLPSGSACARKHPANNVFVPCARDNTQRLPLRRYHQDGNDYRKAGWRSYFFE